MPIRGFHRFAVETLGAVVLALVGGWQLVGADAGEAAFKDVDGGTRTPLGQAGKKATVLFFLLPDCPISNAYAPEIQRICADYEPKKVAMFVVHTDPDLVAQQAKKHAR